jgi:hypothetical protein
MQFEPFYAPLHTLITTHKLDGLDLDVEEEIPLAVLTTLIRRLKFDFGSDFIITLAPVLPALLPKKPLLTPLTRRLLQKTWHSAPEIVRRAFANKPGIIKSMGHLSAFNHFDLEASPEGGMVEWYNVQFYCGWGDASNANGYKAMVQSGWDPQRLVLGVPTNNEACGGNGWHRLTSLSQTIHELNRTYGLGMWGGVMGWEYYGAGRDDPEANEAWNWVSHIGGMLGRGDDDTRLPTGRDAATGASIPESRPSGVSLPVPQAPEAATANINATVQAENAIAATLAERPAPQANSPNEANVSRLVEMGFERAEAEAALEAMGGDVDAAAGLLFGD